VTVSEIDAIVCEITIAAEPETVFDFFTQGELYARWMGRHAQLDARPGGTYAVEINDVTSASGTFVELVRPSRIVFTFGWGGEYQPVPPGSSTVEVTLTPTGGGTHVRLVHRGLRQHEAREQHRQGWGLYLPRLSTVASGGEVGPDPNEQPPAGGIPA
jgi:uncharacterized protein YndB with AHSA1/START domain